MPVKSKRTHEADHDSSKSQGCRCQASVLVVQLCIVHEGNENERNEQYRPFQRKPK
jgi:hypothetical protein